AWTDYSVDLRYRLDFADIYWAAARVGYGVNGFTFSGVDAGLEDLAEAKYKSLKFGLLSGARFDTIDVYLGFNLYQVQEAGAVQARFQSSAITAFGLQLGGMMPISGNIVITARLLYDRFAYTFGDPPAGQTYDASSAVDQLFGLAVGVGYRM
ncbi:MAG: hypothetical protein KJO07_13605, partial [Deltaproteobacteria bacterium]|nr:hypothetical protein [Deltaproteobacteria bacterium]